MSKIIIRNDTELTDLEVLKYVNKVVEGGKISKDNTCYCYVTIFGEKPSQIVVHCESTKTGTQIFWICTK
jgi:hypothetical protein